MACEACRSSGEAPTTQRIYTLGDLISAKRSWRSSGIVQLRQLTMPTMFWSDNAVILARAKPWCEAGPMKRDAKFGYKNSLRTGKDVCKPSSHFSIARNNHHKQPSSKQKRHGLRVGISCNKAPETYQFSSNDVIMVAGIRGCNRTAGTR